VLNPQGEPVDWRPRQFKYLIEMNYDEYQKELGNELTFVGTEMAGEGLTTGGPRLGAGVKATPVPTSGEPCFNAQSASGGPWVCQCPTPGGRA
jgi:hypothetical protein